MPAGSFAFSAKFPLDDFVWKVYELTIAAPSQGRVRARLVPQKETFVRRRHRLVLTAAAAATVLASGPVAAFASAAAPTAPAWSRLPARVYAPYFETWMNESIPVVSAR